MQHRRTSSVSDVWNVNPLVVEVLDGHLLLKLCRRIGLDVGWDHTGIVVTHSTPATKQLHTPTTQR